jgi:hypothetical protein
LQKVSIFDAAVADLHILNGLVEAHEHSGWKYGPEEKTIISLIFIIKQNYHL